MASLRIISYNVNGIRAAMKKGLVDWLKTNPADVICIQETKAEKDNVAHQEITALGYQDYWFSAQKKGYSGVAVFTKIKPDNIQYGTGHHVSDEEGRVIQMDFGDIRLINAYFPSGTSGEIRQGYKYHWLDEMYLYLEELKKNIRVWCCAATTILPTTILIFMTRREIKTLRDFCLQKGPGWINFSGVDGLTVSEKKHEGETGRYSWWSRRFPTVRLNNKGWRIDYINVTTNLADRIVKSDIYPDVKHSDHCPVYLELKKK